MTAPLFIEVTDAGTGSIKMLGLAHIRQIRNSNGRAVIEFADDSTPISTKETYDQVRTSLGGRLG